MIRSRLGRMAAIVLVGGAGAIGIAPPAQARVGVVLGFGPGFWFPPYYYYPPPVYYPPPPVWYTPPPPVSYTPPAYASPGVARSCYAGAYVCPMQVEVSPGTTCWCPNNTGGRAYGTAR
jgi:hypothetical protein